MTRRLFGAATAACVSLGVLGLALASAGAGDAETPTIKSVMQKLNGKGAKAESARLRTALAKPSPDWKTVQTSTKEFAALSASLAKSEPPRGDAESWKKFAEAYASQCQALDDAAGKKSVADTKAAFQKVSMSCMGCHKSHKK
ncbi:MAG: hypothetical protein JWN86_1083 [Planctomycetota bacterium]|nr:hypothetical protein [Planctomycetota bacterium]